MFVKSSHFSVQPPPLSNQRIRQLYKFTHYSNTKTPPIEATAIFSNANCVENLVHYRNLSGELNFRVRRKPRDNSGCLFVPRTHSFKECSSSVVGLSSDDECSSTHTQKMTLDEARGKAC